MRTVGAALALGVALLLSGRAEAQFQNHSVGARLGYIQESPELGVDPTYIPAFGVNGTSYFGSGFQGGFYLDVGIQRQRVAPKLQNLLLYPSFALQYLLIEDYFRPYVGVQASYIHIFFDSAPDGTTNLPTDNLLGAGPLIGAEYSFTDQLSVGASAELVVLWWLNTPIILEPRGFVRVAAHF